MFALQEQDLCDFAGRKLPVRGQLRLDGGKHKPYTCRENFTGGASLARQLIHRRRAAGCCAFWCEPQRHATNFRHWVSM